MSTDLFSLPFVDRFVANNRDYEYSLLPLANNTTGSRVVTAPVTTSFTGIFLADKDANYHLMYNNEFDNISHELPSNILNPLDARFPIVTYGSADYTQFSVSALFVSPVTERAKDNRIIPELEFQLRTQFMNFLKNRKPKIYRDGHGVTKLVLVVGTPSERPLPVMGLMNVNFSMVEIGEVTQENIARLGLTQAWGKMVQSNIPMERVGISSDMLPQTF